MQQNMCAESKAATDLYQFGNEHKVNNQNSTTLTEPTIPGA